MKQYVPETCVSDFKEVCVISLYSNWCEIRFWKKYSRITLPSSQSLLATILKICSLHTAQHHEFEFYEVVSFDTSELQLLQVLLVEHYFTVCEVVGSIPNTQNVKIK